MRTLCATFWGSHGCSLDRGHDEPGHVCGRADDPDDGLCSRIDWDPVERIWLQRFADDDDTWNEERYPVTAFGDDVPTALAAPTDRVDAVRARWQDEGRLSVWEGGRWVKRVRSR